MNKHIIVRKHAPSAVFGLVLGVGVSLAVNPEKRGDGSGAKKDSQASTTDKETSDLRRSQASRALNSSEKGDPEDAQEFLENWLKLHPDDRDFVIGNLAELFFSDPDKYYEIIRDFTLGLYEVDRGLALSTVAFFPREQRIRNLERHVINEWVTADPEALLDSFVKSVSEQLAINDAHLYQLASIYSGEKVGRFDDYISWVAGLDHENEGQGHLQRAAYEALSFHAPPERREELFQDTMERSITDPRFRSFPAILVAEHATEVPREAMTWLDEMEPGPWKDEALYRFLNTAGESQAQAGADLMNRESFLAEFAVAWEFDESGLVKTSAEESSQEHLEKFYDSSLDHFLTHALNNDPELVLESAEAFFNSQLKEEFQSAAKRALAGNVTPILDESNLPACGPNCTHEHHQ